MAIARALDTDAYLRTHAERIYFSGINTEVQSARTILKHIRRDDLPDPFPRRDCHQKHWTGLTEKDQVTEALDVLVEYQWLTVETIATGGRPSTKYSINPKARR
ncbi:MAG: hypothetical protein GY835_01450 [bacterium]|nr:hypothetical protein [bacterium]